jgi:hypothetical protein
VSGAEPGRVRYWIDAQDGSVLRSESTVHHVDVAAAW